MVINGRRQPKIIVVWSLPYAIAAILLGATAISESSYKRLYYTIASLVMLLLGVANSLFGAFRYWLAKQFASAPWRFISNYIDPADALWANDPHAVREQCLRAIGDKNEIVRAHESNEALVFRINQKNLGAAFRVWVHHGSNIEFEAWCLATFDGATWKPSGGFFVGSENDLRHEITEQQSNPAY